MFRHIQNRDLMFGWWSLPSLFVNTYAVISNLLNWLKLQGLSDPIRHGDQQA